ncbi:MAG TPA: extracellular solute-binding protein [Jatrophihabitantaceae bacterium]|jgi:iron(III) transport system substrate-binding protein
MTVRARLGVGICAVALVAASCSSNPSGSSTSELTLYTCASANVEQAVIKAYEGVHQDTKVNVFRAPTGQLNARVAGDLRSGGLRADVIWACDPLTMHGYDTQGLLADWTPADASGIPAAYRGPRFTGVDVLYMVAAVHNGTAPPAAWADLTKPAYRGAVALPDPTFAASALGTLGYLAAAPGYGLDFYKQLRSNGAKQVNSPDEVLTGVEQGRYRAGITLANTAYAGQKKGSPITIVWPQPGGVAIYAPIGITTRKNRASSAGEFASFVAGPAGQKIMAGAGTYVAMPGMGGPPLPAGRPVAEPDWPKLFGNYKSVLAGYAAVFGN